MVVSSIFYFHPEPWGRFPFWLIFFRGLKPPTSKGCHFVWENFWSRSWYISLQTASCTGWISSRARRMEGMVYHAGHDETYLHIFLRHFRWWGPRNWQMSFLFFLQNKVILLMLNLQTDPPTGPSLYMKATRRENPAARAMWASGRCVLIFKITLIWFLILSGNQMGFWMMGFLIWKKVEQKPCGEGLQGQASKMNSSTLHFLPARQKAWFWHHEVQEWILWLQLGGCLRSIAFILPRVIWFYLFPESINQFGATFFPKSFWDKFGAATWHIDSCHVWLAGLRMWNHWRG